MNVLAYKSKKSAIISLVCFFASLGMVYIGFKYGYDIIWGYRNTFYFWLFVSGLVIASISSMFEYLRQPQVLIEYDECGLYVYKRRNSEPIIIRYEDIFGADISVGVGTENTEMMDLGQLQKGFVSKSKAGHLKIRLKNYETIDIRHVKNAKQVQIDLNKKINEEKRERRERYNELIELERRERELKEHLKHNVNT